MMVKKQLYLYSDGRYNDHEEYAWESFYYLLLLSDVEKRILNLKKKSKS